MKINYTTSVENINLQNNMENAEETLYSFFMKTKGCIAKYRISC